MLIGSQWKKDRKQSVFLNSNGFQNVSLDSVFIRLKISPSEIGKLHIFDSRSPNWGWLIENSKNNESKDELFVSFFAAKNESKKHLLTFIWIV